MFRPDREDRWRCRSFPKRWQPTPADHFSRTARDTDSQVSVVNIKKDIADRFDFDSRRSGRCIRNQNRLRTVIRRGSRQNRRKS